jgi:hypothetical protein|tara:strand:- start:85 stop:921 length:837 start_codon:yes stop_codon:yes gene_type:complete
MAYSKKRALEITDIAEDVGICGASALLGISIDSVKRACRMANYTEANEDGPVLVFSDLHAPYHHPKAIEFLKYIHRIRGCRERVVCAGDMWDFHSMSFHKSEPDAPCPEKEYAAVRAFSAELAEAFPHGDLVLGNHCDIPRRQMVDKGLAISMLKEGNDLYNLPETWSIHPLYHVIDPEGWNVLVEHRGLGGKYGCMNAMKEKRCSFIQGHTHASAMVGQSSNYRDTVFGANSGWLGDGDSLAARYGEHMVKKGNLGCLVVYSGEHAEFIPMSSMGKL